MDRINHQYRLAARPQGLVKPTDFEWTEEPVGEPGDGELVVQIRYASLDPAMRGWMNAGRSYLPPVEIGAVMRAGGIGRVVASNHPGFAVGDHVSGMFGLQEYATNDGTGIVKVDPDVAPLPVHLSLLGSTGMTAYFGLLDIGRPEPGQTVVVSAAAGAVGSIVGQIAKRKGCRVIGIAGGPEKCAYLTDDLGFDGSVDYKAGSVRRALAEQCPDGIDVYFDNVGGEILDAALSLLARHARVVICGAISQYNATEPPAGPANYMSLLVNRARMEGFLVFDYAPRYREAAVELAKWRADGSVRSREDVVTGLKDFPEHFLRLFSGANDGKLVLEVAAADDAD